MKVLRYQIAEVVEGCSYQKGRSFPFSLFFFFFFFALFQVIRGEIETSKNQGECKE